MDNINKSNSKLSYEELLQENSQLKKQIKEINQKPIRIVKEYNRIQEIVHIGTWYLDLATNEVEWTEELFKMYGFDPALPVPPYTEHMKLFTKESWELLSKSLANTAETGIPYELELKTVREDKSNGWMWVRGETVTDDEGKIIGLWGAARDITEKKKSEVLLSDSEAKYRALYENAPISYQSLDVDGNFIDINPTWLSTLGYKREEVIGKNYGDFLHPEWKSHFATNFPEFKKRGYVSDVQFKIRHKKGHYIDISFEGCIGTYPDGSFKQTYCVFKDITENKQIEEALNKNQFYLSKAQAMGKIGTWELDIINNKLIWTKENYKNFGLKYGAPLTYEIFLNCIHPDDRDYANREWTDALNGKPYDIEHRVIEDGKVKWLREKADIKFDANGNAVSAIGFTQDITEFKESEIKLIKTESIQRKMVANIGDVIVIIDKNGINRYKSPNVKRQFGWEVDELVGKSAWDKVHPDHIESAKELLSDLVHEPKKKITTVLRYLRKDGEYRWIEITISNLLYDPEIDGFLGNYHDITERKLDEEALRSSQEMLLSSQSLADICSYSTNLIVTDIDKSYWVCSPEFYKIFGIDETYPHTIEGWIGFLHPDYRDNVVAYHESVVLEKKSFNREYKIIRINDGVERWVHGTGELVYDKKGNPIRMHGAIQDITEHKLAELALQESEWYLEKAQGVTKTGYYIWDLENSILIWSNEMFNIYGLKQENGTPSPEEYINFVHEDDKYILSPEHMEMIIQKPNHELQYKIIDQSTNDVKHIYLWGETIFNNTGKPVRVIGVIQDITKQKNTEFELINAKGKAEARNNQVNAMLDAIPDLVFRVDANSVILDYKADIKDLYYQKTSIIGKKYHDVLPQNIVELIDKNIKLTLDKNSIQTFEYTLHLPTVGNCEYEARMTKSGPKEVTVWVRDITETNKNRNELIIAKEKAEESEKQLRHISDNFVNGMIYQVAMLEENHRQFNYVSKNVQELYGCTVEEAKKDANLIYGKIHPDDIEGLIEKEKVALKKMSKFETEARTITPNGNIRWAYYISKPRIINGVVCWDGIEIDITERKQMELELIKAKEKAEESDRLKSAFLANMSHEIRTPMNGILGFTSLLQEADLSVENQKEYIDIIEKSGNRLLNTVNDIIEISKIESGEINVIKSEVDIIGHLNTLVTFFRPEAKKKNIDIIVQNSIDGNGLFIQTDKNKLSSILSNLIKNAIKYTNEGTIKVGLKIENNQVLFSCQDTGIGIPKNRQEAIFNRFEQADIEDKHAHQGSGLGLAIVKSYVEMFEGEIWVESEEGQGSTFYVSLPFEHEKKKEQNIPKEVKSSDSGIKNINVLVVEDEEYSSMHLSIILKDKVKNISTAKNGIEAMDACKNDSGIDLILMDIKMPVMDGIEATKKIRKFNKDVVIIAQTAYALEGDKEKALDAGCNDYISKPIKKDKLFELINKYF